MHCDVVEVKPIEHLALEVRFADGVQGRARLLENALVGVFAVLKDPVFFAKVESGNGFITWPGELDLAPDAMYEAIKRSGKWHFA